VEKPLQKFCQIFFSHQKPLFIACQKSRHLWHILCVGKTNHEPLQEPLMNRRNRTASLFLISPMFFVSCDNVEQAVQSSRKKPIPAMMVALELEQTIRAKLASNETLKRADLDVRVQAAKNKATLWAIVSSEHVREQAFQLARSAQSGLIVNDKMAIRPGGLR
jgi:hypothetical protein